MNDLDSKHETEESKNERLNFLLEDNLFDIIQVLNLETLEFTEIKTP